MLAASLLVRASISMSFQALSAFDIEFSDCRHLLLYILKLLIS
jgi:hypothetical protein